MMQTMMMMAATQSAIKTRTGFVKKQIKLKPKPKPSEVKKDEQVVEEI